MSLCNIYIYIIKDMFVTSHHPSVSLNQKMSLIISKNNLSLFGHQNLMGLNTYIPFLLVAVQ